MSGRVSYPQLAAVVKEFTKRPLTVREMSRIGGTSYQSARYWVSVLHQAKLVHIVGYVKTPRTKSGSRLFAWGEGLDATNPKLTPAAVSRRWRQRRNNLDSLWVGSK